MHPFLRLEDLLLAPPLPALIALFIVLGTLYVSRWLMRLINAESVEPVDRAAAFMLTAGIIAAAAHAFAWAGYASVTAWRLAGWGLATLGVVEVASWKISEAKRMLLDQLAAASFAERCAIALSIVSVAGLMGAALGPAVDADSLDYHLGVPLEWLRRGGAYPTPNWYTSRYVGLGEALNMLGLAAGTDALGASFQAAGVVAALIGVAAFAPSRANRLFAFLLVVACPVVFLLTVSQKPQMLPSAALLLALVILVGRSARLNLSSAILAFGCISFAMASKHSFLLTGAIIVLLGFIAAARDRRLGLALSVSAGCFLVLAVPVFARNFMFYGDPISPMLERWRPDADPAIVAFAQQALREYGGAVTLGKIARLPWDLAFTLTPGLIQHVLGIGVFAFLFAVRERGAVRLMLLAALAAAVLVVALGQVTPRFFFDSYLWSAAAAAAAPWSRVKEVFFKLVTLQALVTSSVAVYLGAVLVSGALTETGRERVMTKMALNYSEAKWLDAVLPPDAVIFVASRSRVLLPRPSVFPDPFLSWSKEHDDPIAASADWRAALLKLIEENRVTMLVSEYPIRRTSLLWLAGRYGRSFAGPMEFRAAARSPFNRGDPYHAMVTMIEIEGSNSAAR